MRGESRSRSRSPTRGNEFGGGRGGERGERGERVERVEVPPSNKVYVSFLPEEIEQTELRQLFQECGPVTRLFLKKKQDGFTFAYINYETVDEARDAIDKLNRRKVGGKNIRVQFGREMPRGERGNSSESREQRGGGRGEDFKRQSDTRRKFGDRGGFEPPARNDFQGRDRGSAFNGGDRGGAGGRGGPIKCYKCQGEGHISRNCTAEEGEQRRGGGEQRPHRAAKVDKMSEDEFNDY